MWRHEANSAGGHNFLSASTPSSSFSQTQFPSPLFANLDPNLQSSPHLLQPATHNGTSYPRQQTPEARVQGSMQPPSISPQMQRSSPRPGAKTPGARSLPSRDVAEDTLTDTYVEFILYCNPHFKPDVDTETLRTNFNSPPKSDNKEFETWRLFELISAFDRKEIKTWGQLALDLGVESPKADQSVQKVQQYTVRLKRWMRAMHIDAFFELLLGKQHTYFTDVPPINDPYPPGGRDGVAAEEDLAIRALDPAFRPKRGRRRNSDVALEEAEEAAAAPANKQARLRASQTVPMSAYPSSAHPDHFQDPWPMASAVTPQSFAPWQTNQHMNAPHTAVTSTAPQHLRWQLHSGAEVQSPHPMTAHPTSMAAQFEAALDNQQEPKSSVAGPARRRRKHGPAVSSAWPSSSAPGAKPRGRPPANRNVQDGPFGTFPVEARDERSSTPAKVATPDLAQTQHTAPSAQMSRPPIVQRQSEGPGRPVQRLSLQVPAHTGGPVRLATPPVPAPKVLLNGEANDSGAESGSGAFTPIVAPGTQPGVPHPQRQPRVSANMQAPARELPGFAFEVLKRVLASDLLRAQLTGRQSRLTGDEAKRLADAVLHRMGIPRQDTESSKDDIARLTAASWLGIGEQLNVPLGPATGTGKKIVVTRFRMDAEGYEEIVSAMPAEDEDIGEVREVFDLLWTASIAGCTGTFTLQGLSLAPPNSEDAGEWERVGDLHDHILANAVVAAKAVGVNSEPGFRRALMVATRMKDGFGELGMGEGNGRGRGNDDGIDWKARALAMEFGSMLAKGELERVKNAVFEKLVEVLL